MLETLVFTFHIGSTKYIFIFQCWAIVFSVYTKTFVNCLENCENSQPRITCLLFGYNIDAGSVFRRESLIWLEGIYRARKMLRNQTSKNLGYTVSDKIFINENLTERRKEMFRV